MSYQSALEAAGCTVIDFRQFGSYQGDWFAIVRYKGTIGVIQGAYGSCSGCDAFESEFNDSYSSDDTDEEYAARLKKFGEGYLTTGWISIDEALTYAGKHEEWDMSAADMTGWLQSLKNAHFANKLKDVLNDKA